MNNFFRTLTFVVRFVLHEQFDREKTYRETGQYPERNLMVDGVNALYWKEGHRWPQTSSLYALWRTCS